jgi:hypothetical protein
MKKVTGYFARSECLLPRNMRWCERQEFICGRCHWSEFYHQVIGIVPTEVHFQSTEKDFTFFLITELNIYIRKKSYVSIKLRRTRFSPYTLSFSCIVHIIVCLVWNGRNCTTLPYLTRILFSYLPWGYILRLLKRLFCYRSRYEDENSAFKSSE